MDLLAFRQRSKQERLVGAAGALALQAGFLLLFLYSFPQISRPIETAQEMILVFRRNLPPPPPLPALQPELPPPAPVPSAPSLLFTPPAVSTPPSLAVPDLRGFGGMLNDCAPEIYFRLTPEKQARCPHPAEGWAAQKGAGIDIAPRSHAKDVALWQEDWDEKHWTAGLCDTAMGLVALCQMHQAIAEHERADDVRWHLVRAKAEGLKMPPPKLPDGARAKN